MRRRIAPPFGNCIDTEDGEGCGHRIRSGFPLSSTGGGGRGEEAVSPATPIRSLADSALNASHAQRSNSHDISRVTQKNETLVA